MTKQEFLIKFLLANIERSADYWNVEQVLMWGEKAWYMIHKSSQ